MISYSDLVCQIKKLETPRVTALFLPDSCATFSLPVAFKNLFFALVDSLTHNIDLLCQPNHMLCLFSLQTVSVSIQSDFPLKFNRVYYTHAKNTHFCCILQYLTKPIENFALESHSSSHLSKQMDWQQAQSVIVDFTVGEIFNHQHYLFKVLNKNQMGQIYGQLPTEKLKQAWMLYQLTCKN